MSGEFDDLDHDHPVVRDKRRFDPTTGEPRVATPAATGGTSAGDPAEDLSVRAQPHSPGVDGQTDNSEGEAELALLAQLDERTADLQRVQAEYANYRRRVERDRQAVAEAALASVLTGLLPVLDDIDRARSHGESSQGFLLLAEGLDTTLTKLGLERFGSAGEPFDPTVHEALTHAEGGSDLDGPTCSEIYQPGYRVGDRVLRPARVGVSDPGSGATTDTGPVGSADGE